MHWLYNSDNLIKGHISSCSPDCLQEIISRDGLVRRNKVLSILCGNPRWAVVQQLVELGAVHLIQKLSKRLAPLFARKICAVDGGNHLCATPVTHRPWIFQNYAHRCRRFLYDQSADNNRTIFEAPHGMYIKLASVLSCGKEKGHSSPRKDEP